MLFTSKVLVWQLWFCKNFNLKTAPAYWGLTIVFHVCLRSSSFVTRQTGQIRTKLHMLPDSLLLQIHLSGILYQSFLTSQLGSFLVFPLLRDCPVFFAFAQCCLYILRVYHTSVLLHTFYVLNWVIFSVPALCCFLPVSRQNLKPFSAWKYESSKNKIWNIHLELKKYIS